MAELSNLYVKISGNNSSLDSAVNKSIGLLDQFGRAFQKVETAEEKATQATNELGSAFHKLKMQTDNAYAGMDRYRRAADLVEKVAIKQGWSVDQLNSELSRLSHHYGVAAQTGHNLNDSLKSGRFHTANLAAQFYDIGVMMSSGQSPLILAAQQGTQVAQVLQTAGANGKQTFKMLSDALFSVLSPMTLLTIGVIAGAAALGQFFMAMDKGNTAAKRQNELLDTSKTTYDELTTAIKENNNERRIALGLSLDKVTLKAEDEITAIKKERLAIEKELVDIANKYQAVGGRGVGAAAAYETQAARKRGAALEARQAELANLLTQYNYQEKVAIAERRRANEYKEAAKIRLSNEQAAQAAQDKLNAKLSYGKDLFHLMAGETASVSFYLGEAFTRAAEHAAKQEEFNKKLNYGKDLFHLLAGETSSVSFYLSEALKAAVGLASVDFRNVTAPLQFGRGGAGRVAADSRTNSPYVGRTPSRGFIKPPAPFYSPSTGGVDPIKSELEQLQTALKTAEQLEADSYAKRLELLKSSLQQKYITQQEYNTMMEQVEATHSFAILKQQDANVSTVLGALGDLFQGSKKIGAGIALANSYIAFTEVLKDPAYVGRPWARFAAAASALSSGLAAVRSIKSAQPGGTGSGGISSGASGGASSGGGGGSQTSTHVALTLVGESFGRPQVLKLINEINKAMKDGAVINLR